jgi:hypothetical protein
MIKVYQYGCYLRRGEEVVLEQLRLAHRYRNKLCEITRNHREQISQITLNYSAELCQIERAIATCDAEIHNFSSQIKALKAQARSAVKSATAALRARVDALKTQKKELRARFKEIRTLLREDPALKEQLDEAGKARNALINAARQTSGVFWGTCLHIEKALDNWDYNWRKFGIQSQFRSYRGEGSVGIQIQKNSRGEFLSVKEAFEGKDNRLKLEKIPCPINPDSPLRQEEQWIRASLRIQSGEKLKPIYAVVEFPLSRELPENALIKWCYLARKSWGNHWEWDSRCEYHIQFTLSYDPEQVYIPDPACSVDIGWRLFPGERLRVGVFTGEVPCIDNDEIPNSLRANLKLWENRMGGELSIPYRIIDKLEYAESVLGIRDTAFERARDTLADWIDGREFDQGRINPMLTNQYQNLQTAIRKNKQGVIPMLTRKVRAFTEVGEDWPTAPVEIPQELRERLCNRHRSENPDPDGEPGRISLRQWKSANRLARVVHFWSQNRFAGDEKIFAFLREWSKHNTHLFDIAMGIRRNVRLYRTNLYRNFAAFLRKNYGTVVLEDIDWRTFMRNPPVESDETNTPAKRRWYTALASPGHLSELIQQGMPQHTLVEPAQTTMNCFSCGETNYFDQDKNLHHTCDHCGVRWDQDVNAAHNLLMRGLAAREQVVETE